ncbi:hypothetical protein DERP_015262 [Dermatophagoides pteronyssinus]|uniref:Uncharacterized protein n=1 Tax=Dermatophagoides pteronyssinus TaxID=6956 RepID=A0ABQ8JKM8_DERPT|nr:hypothetical protein DERP_015262 [Dermatophagoides pteronyssinus]
MGFLVSLNKTLKINLTITMILEKFSDKIKETEIKILSIYQILWLIEMSLQKITVTTFLD